VEDGYRLSFRYACPSATHNKGRPVSEQRGELKAMAEGLEQWHRENHEEPVVGEVPPPPLQPGQKVGWKDLLRFVAALQNIVTQQAEPFPKRLLRCLALARLCRQATFDKITGSRLREFLELVVPALDAELPQDLQALAAPSWVGRILFRSFLSIFLRKDQGVRRGLRARGVLPFLFGIWRMTRGTGTLPQLQQGLPNKTFTEMEEPFGPLEPTSLELLQRYYAIKLESLQFCGPTFFDYPFWDGLEMLLLTFPMVLWLARGYRELGQPESIHRALNIIDENFGYSPLLRSVRHRYSLSILRSRGELDRLIAWYAR
jgi:lysine-N-methylase